MDEEVIKVTNKKIRNFGILSTKKEKRIGQKRTEMSYQFTDTFRIKALQNLEEHHKLNPINVRITSNQVINDLTKYKNYRYRFIVEDLLFSFSITNETNITFITCNGLNDAKPILANGKTLKSLGVISLSQIKSWNKVKGNSNWIIPVLIDSEYPFAADHFSFTFTTKNLSDLIYFTFELVDPNGQSANFSSTEKKFLI